MSSEPSPIYLVSQSIEEQYKGHQWSTWPSLSPANSKHCFHLKTCLFSLIYELTDTRNMCGFNDHFWGSAKWIKKVVVDNENNCIYGWSIEKWKYYVRRHKGDKKHHHIDVFPSSFMCFSFFGVVHFFSEERFRSNESGPKNIEDSKKRNPKETKENLFFVAFFHITIVDQKTRG